MNKKLKIFIRFSALFMLIAVTACLLLSCSHEQKEAEPGAEISITVTVTGKNGVSTVHLVRTNRTNLGDALLDAGIAEGTMDQYGLYITAVDDEVADYSVDSSYWGLFRDGEMLMTGASMTPIADGDCFELVYTIS